MNECTLLRNLSTTLRHSIDCSPAESANVIAETVYAKDGPHVIVFTTRDIKKGEEILLDYGGEYWTGTKITPLFVLILFDMFSN